MNFFDSSFINSPKENYFVNKLDSKNECIKIKLQNSTNGNFNNYQVCSNDSYNNLEKSNLKINFEILDNKLNNNVIKSQKNIIKIKEKNNIYSNNGSQLNNVIEKNTKKNQESNLKIKIPFDVLDNHPLFLVKRVNEKNKNCKLKFNIIIQYQEIKEKIKKIQMRKKKVKIYQMRKLNVVLNKTLIQKKIIIYHL